MNVFDTIVAECSAPMKAAVSMVRLSGKDSFEILSHVVKKDVNSFEARKMYYVSFYEDQDDEDSLIDRGTLVLYKDGKSYTGEDTVEFFVHGSPLIVNRLISALIRYGARRALGGEFTEKAYLNGKMDLSEAEAVNQLINARTEKSRKFALKTLNGDASGQVKEMKKELNLLTAEIEVDIDYPEYDENVEIAPKIEKVLPPLLKKAEVLLAGSRQSTYLFNGIKVAIVGEPNVGKSTLLNKILGEEKAIVTDVPGTTRDVVEGEKEIHGLLYRFYDTAGIREAAGEIEKIGIEKTYDTIAKSDIVLLLFEKGQQIEEEIDKLEIRDLIRDKPCLTVSTKKDLNGIDKDADVSLSKEDPDLEEMFKKIEKKLDISDKDGDGFASKRDLDLLETFVSDLKDVLNDLKNKVTVDVLEIKLIEATHALDEMLGVENTMEDVYQTVFANFCVGK